MAQCYLTSHVEISTIDRVVGGRTIKQGQAIIVSDVQVGGGAGNSQIDICKIAQYVGNKLECVPMFDDLLALSGTDGTTLQNTVLFGSPSATFVTSGVVAGDFVVITTGNSPGTYAVVQVLAETVLELGFEFPDTEADLSWSITRNERRPDYSKVLRALPVSNEAALPQLRYIPLLGPGDHASNQGQTAVNVALLVDTTADFTDVLRPIPTDGTAYVEILTGADAGFHKITAVAATVLDLSANLTATATDIHYRVRLVSPHATHVMVSDWGSEKVAIPIQDSFEVKIASAIRNLADAEALDVASEIPKTTRAVDLFAVLGPFLGCYRLQRGASETQGMPLDKRVLIPAKPWRGHDVDGVLFFRADGLQKYTASAINPVFPIRWLRDMYRVEIAIARSTRQQPTSSEECV